jgi:RES domain-containing protein
MARPTLRDSGLIDALEALSARPFKGTAWRVVREGRDPTQCSAPGGRWDDGTFDVLYTSLERNGALAEMEFHLRRGQPVFPSKVRYTLHEIEIELSSVLHFPDLDSLSALGLDTSQYGQLSYVERLREYVRTQEIAEVAHFLDRDGLIIPNARWNCANLTVFCDRAGPDATAVTRPHGIVDWVEWQRATRRT